MEHECRCAYCENVYGKGEDFEEYKDSPICDKCHAECIKADKEELMQGQ